MSESLRVVIVEDEAIVLMQLQTLLEDIGHEVVGTAMSAREAISLIDLTSPELVLLDLHLQGGSSGFDVAHAFRERTDVTIVFVTANVGKLPADMEGAAAAIAKPFTERTFVGSIAFLEQCVHRPPPASETPHGLHLSPTLVARYESQRSHH